MLTWPAPSHRTILWPVPFHNWLRWTSHFRTCKSPSTTCMHRDSRVRINIKSGNLNFVCFYYQHLTLLAKDVDRVKLSTHSTIIATSLLVLKRYRMVSLFFLLSIKLPIVRTQVPWMRSIDEKENAKYLSRFFLAGGSIVPSGGGHERQSWIMTHSDQSWLLSFPLCSMHTVSRERTVAGGGEKKALHSHLCSFPVK